MIRYVAPHAGAWVEMLIIAKIFTRFIIALHTGAWVEIIHKLADETALLGRSLRGSVG